MDDARRYTPHGRSQSMKIIDVVVLFSLVLTYPVVAFDWQVQSMVRQFTRNNIREIAML